MIYMHIYMYVKTLTKKIIQTDEKKQLNKLIVGWNFISLIFLLPKGIVIVFLFQVIFSEMFRLPMSYHTQVFYGSLIMELCKLRSDTIPGIVSFLYLKLKYM